METIGTYLKREREMRKIPLEDISQSTKISLQSLSALETDNLKALPGPIFAKGFVRSYAKAIGLNVEETLLHFEENIQNILPGGIKQQKFRWLKPQRFYVQSWVWILLFATVVVMAAYLSSR